MFNYLTIDDIMDSRSYERRREQFRAEIIAVKKLRRVAVGPIMTLLFENRSTILFQIQEMARAEKMTTDAQIEIELDTYNPLIPARNELSATLFLELTSKDEMLEWLPKLVGIEESIEIEIASPKESFRIPSITEAAHKMQLTRPDVTASVHYIRFDLGADAAAAMANSTVTLRSVHHRYSYETVLSPETVASLCSDWLPATR